jgi:intein/homing endonuclease
MSNQTYIPNTKYLIKTKNGFEPFEGISRTSDTIKESRKIVFLDSSSITCTDDHIVYTTKGPTQAKDIKIGDDVVSDNNKIKSVVEIIELVLNDVYDIFNTPSHTILANDCVVHQCDELAFVNRRIALEFWTSVFPTLSCLSGDTYVLNSVDGYRRIDSYLEDGVHYTPGNYYKVLGENIWGLDGVEELSHFYISPESETLKITTSSGFKVEVTLKHPLYLQYRGMVEAKDLKVGDKVMVNYV